MKKALNDIIDKIVHERTQRASLPNALDLIHDIEDTARAGLAPLTVEQWLEMCPVEVVHVEDDRGGTICCGHGDYRPGVEVVCAVRPGQKVTAIIIEREEEKQEGDKTDEMP